MSELSSLHSESLNNTVSSTKNKQNNLINQQNVIRNVYIKSVLNIKSTNLKTIKTLTIVDVYVIVGVKT